MSDRASNSTGGGTVATSSGSLVQIGHYVLGETLGIGTFGKVKGKKNLTNKTNPAINISVGKKTLDRHFGE